MSYRSFQGWLEQGLIASTGSAPAPNTEHWTVQGILGAVGLTTSKVIILDERPVDELTLAENVQTCIIFEVFKTLSSSKSTSGGAYAPRFREHKVGFNVVWLADFTGNPVQGVAPEFSTQAQSKRVFDKIMHAVERTINLLIFKTSATGITEAANWPLTDTDTGEVSTVIGELPNIEIYKPPVTPLENSRDKKYTVFGEATFLEQYRLLTPT